MSYSRIPVSQSPSNWKPNTSNACNNYEIVFLTFMTYIGDFCIFSNLYIQIPQNIKKNKRWKNTDLQYSHPYSIQTLLIMNSRCQNIIVWPKKKKTNQLYHWLIICLLRLDMVQIFSWFLLRHEPKVLHKGITGNNMKDWKSLSLYSLFLFVNKVEVNFLLPR